VTRAARSMKRRSAPPFARGGPLDLGVRSETLASDPRSKQPITIETEEIRMWQQKLVLRYPTLFLRPFRGLPFAPGFPRVPPGWSDLVTVLVERVAAAAIDGSVYFTHVIEEHGVLRVHWASRSELAQKTAFQVEESVALAEARSSCTCAECGAEGRLFASDFVISPMCALHEHGAPVPIVAGVHDVFIRRAVVRQRSSLVRVTYDRENDSFVPTRNNKASRG
jgi:hypothetical protein